MQDLTQQKNKEYLIEFDNEQYNIIKAQFFPQQATPLEIDYCFNVAKSLGLNPLLGEIYFVERQSNVNGRWVKKIEPLAGRNAFRKIANRSGKLEHIKTETMLKNTPKLVNGKWVDGSDLVAICTIKRKDAETPFVVEVEYSEYVQKKRDGTPTKFWIEKPKTMLKKVAEAQCLRMAFDISGIYEESELDTTIDVEKEYINPKLQSTREPKPQRRKPTMKEIKAQEFLQDENIVSA